MREVDFRLNPPPAKTKNAIAKPAGQIEVNSSIANGARKVMSARHWYVRARPPVVPAKINRASGARLVQTRFSFVPPKALP